MTKTTRKVMAIVLSLALAFSVTPLASFAADSHQHDDSCYTVSKTLICQIEESEEHSHSEECYSETKDLTCTLPAQNPNEDNPDGIMPAPLAVAPLATAPQSADEPFTIVGIEGGARNDAIVKGEPRSVFCMQYDNLWPSQREGGANPVTKYTEADSVYLLTDAQLNTVRKLIFAGYPYNCAGILNPLYDEYGIFVEYMGLDADITQGALWTLMAEYGVPGNEHYDSADAEQFPDEPASSVFSNLIDFAKSSTPLPVKPSNNKLTISGSGNFVEAEDDTYIAGPFTVVDPEGFKSYYKLSVPDGITILDADKNPINPYDFYDETDIRISGGTQFYLQTDSVDSLDDTTVLTANCELVIPTDFKMYVTNDIGKGSDKDNPGSYIQRPFQTMLSVGKDTLEMIGNLALTYGQPDTGGDDDQPGTGGDDDQPGTGGDDDQPGTGGDDDQPGTGGDDDQPGTGGDDDQPGTGGDDDQPGTGGDDDQPGTGGDDDQPGTGGDDTPDKPSKPHKPSNNDKPVDDPTTPDDSNNDDEPSDDPSNPDDSGNNDGPSDDPTTPDDSDNDKPDPNAPGNNDNSGNNKPDDPSAPGNGDGINNNGSQGNADQPGNTADTNNKNNSSNSDKALNANNPKTGDEDSPVLAMILAIASLLGIAGIAVSRRKYSK